MWFSKESTSMKLTDLLTDIPYELMAGDADREITGVA